MPESVAYAGTHHCPLRAHHCPVLARTVVAARGMVTVCAAIAAGALAFVAASRGSAGAAVLARTVVAALGMITVCAAIAAGALAFVATSRGSAGAAVLARTVVAARRNTRGTAEPPFFPFYASYWIGPVPSWTVRRARRATVKVSRAFVADTIASGRPAAFQAMCFRAGAPRVHKCCTTAQGHNKSEQHSTQRPRFGWCWCYCGTHICPRM
jgi:hypothetical protein